MPISEHTLQRFNKLWIGSWVALSAKTGIDAWDDFMRDIDTDDECFSLAFDEIIQERIDKQKFHRLNDRPSLNEMKYYYYKRRNNLRSDSRSATERVNCDYCDNKGRRYVIMHSEHSTGHDEAIITSVPQDINQIKMFCYYITIPCTCPKGQGAFRVAVKSQEVSNPMQRDRQIDILKQSFKHSDAATIIDDYLRIRNHKFYGEPLNPPETEFTKQLKNAIRRMAAGDTGERKFKPKAPIDPVEKAYDDHLQEP